ncbi:MAG: response regulator [Zetaproteobacteria bacterium]|nr:response regulator [Pseudobdellovibrionaceae bacterium]|tara:strand:+ start:2452 stop:2844 length:393 start_codon:yes stop_codon:yes gene_type:complete
MARVLVVEDNEDQRVQIVEGLRDAGHEVFEAEDGQVGYDLAMKTDNIDLIFADQVMPNKTGLEMVEELRAQPKYQDVIVLFYTTQSKRSLKQQGKILGVTRWLVKPSPVSVVIKTVQLLVDQRDQAKKAS